MTNAIESALSVADKWPAPDCVIQGLRSGSLSEEAQAAAIDYLLSGEGSAQQQHACNAAIWTFINVAQELRDKRASEHAKAALKNG